MCILHIDNAVFDYIAHEKGLHWLVFFVHIAQNIQLSTFYAHYPQIVCYNRVENKHMERGVNMEIDVLLQAIATLGFPIVMCVALLWEIKDMTTKHQEETKLFSDSMNKNTLVLQKLCDVLGVEREEENE